MYEIIEYSCAEQGCLRQITQKCSAFPGRGARWRGAETCATRASRAL